MFGADTALVFDAVIMIGAAIVGTAGIAVLVMRKNKSVRDESGPATFAEKSNLEKRVQVLERIATDRSMDLADEIEALRDDHVARTKEQELS